ncbi:MAG: M6 family metalloprotease domain-containing protein [Calditrichaeota bacterium]|nr:MAG: M6 family metalloprotease domain-containing protein [Calditrichota bacterium]
MQFRQFSRTRMLLLSIIAVFSLFVLISTATAMPLKPEIVEQLKESGQLEVLQERLAQAKARGVCQPFEHQNAKHPGQYALSFDPEVADTFRVVVILADFADNQAEGGQVFGSVADFEHLLFSFDSTDGHYSMTEFYMDNSYGNFYIDGIVVGWYQLPQTYAYYVDGQNGFGSYPTNAQRMAEDAINLADPAVDYSQFDNDNNGWCDGVFVVHAGPGAESTSSDNHIWSHAWSTSFTMNLDGINIQSYTTEPEELSGQLITQGVYSHEYGHFLGLPDLYDTDYSSSGIGDWSLMAGGSWNAGGRHPAFMDAWCKKELGFVIPINVTSNLIQEEIPTSLYNPVVYRLWENGSTGNEYFLVENRQKSGNDYGIPGSGLLIYHINENNSGNWNEPNYLVGIEQADNEMDLEAGSNQGDGNDVWSTSTKTEFSDLSMPNSNRQSGTKTKVAVWDISANDSLMYANLDINYSAPRFNIISSSFSDADFGNNNGVIEIGETITFSFSVNNLWLTSTNVTGTMFSDNPDFIFTTPSVNIGTVNGEGGSGSNSGLPIVFDVPLTFDPCIDSFYLNITSDNPLGDKTFGFELHVGSPEVVVIDDDNGDAWELHITDALTNLRIPYEVYDKSQFGSPPISYLDKFNIIIWLTGSDRTGIFTASDVTAMADFMDKGKNIYLNGQSAAQDLATLDQTFFNSYFKADYDSDLLFPLLTGQPGTKIGDGINLRYNSGTNQTSPERMSLAGGGGVSEFELQVGGSVGISYEGSYRSFFTSFGFEGVSNIFESSGFASQDTLLARVLKFFDYGDVNKFSNPYVDTIQLPNENIDAVVSTTPVFNWSYSDTTGSTQTLYQVQVGTGDFCFNASDMWDSGVLSGTLDSVVYSGMPLEDGVTYFVRSRVYNGTNWSKWRRIPFTMNAAPTPGLILGPDDYALALTAQPTLTVDNGIDVNGDPLTYGFDVATDDAFTNIVASITGVAEGAGTTSWMVDTPLSDNILYFWRASVSDPYESGGYSDSGFFAVNALNNPPNPFGLNIPEDSAANVGIMPLLAWEDGNDDDFYDQRNWTLVYSTDETFTISTSVDVGSDTMYTFALPLDDNTVYYWKVYVKDLAGDSTESNQTRLFNTGSFGCCQNFRGNVDNDAGDTIDIADIVYLVAHMFSGGPAPVCFEEADIEPDAVLDIGDLVFLVAYSFSGGPPPASCP